MNAHTSPAKFRRPAGNARIVCSEFRLRGALEELGAYAATPSPASDQLKAAVEGLWIAYRALDDLLTAGAELPPSALEIEPPSAPNTSAARDAWEEVTTAIGRMHDLAHATEYVVQADLQSEPMVRETLTSMMLLIEEQAKLAKSEMDTVWGCLVGRKSDPSAE